MTPALTPHLTPTVEHARIHCSIQILWNEGVLVNLKYVVENNNNKPFNKYYGCIMGG